MRTATPNQTMGSANGTQISPSLSTVGPAKPFETYPGSKDAGGAAEKIIGTFPPHALYVEPFLGGGAVLRRKAPALASIGIDNDAAVVERWRGVNWPGLEVIEADSFEWLRTVGPTLPADALVYADPPYMHEARSKRRLYRCELTDAQHEELLGILCALPCSVAVSGYWTPLYAARLEGWKSINFDCMTRGGVRREWLWHRSTIASFTVGDVRYAGTDFRDRERIKRKAARWATKFARMDARERAAVLSALLRMPPATPAPATMGDLP